MGCLADIIVPTLFRPCMYNIVIRYNLWSYNTQIISSYCDHFNVRSLNKQDCGCLLAANTGIYAELI